jgi:hypothetical protein|tara:strand:- start:1196 stop:1477 length:282 start_codon:yes stop_codon:yes gene_type:complete
MDSKQKIKETCGRIYKLLSEKNEAYGDSALTPLNIFSKGTPSESLCARIDDKLARIKNRGVNDETEDTLMDLCGYLILLMIAKDNEDQTTQEG